MRNRLSILVANISILLLALPAPAFAFDTDGPSVGAVVVSPSSADISQSAVTVTATVTATDVSGVDQARLPRANFYNMSDVGTMRSFTLVLKSGDAKNGTYQASYTVPINAKPGNWSVLVDGFVDLGGFRSTNGSHEGLFKVLDAAGKAAADKAAADKAAADKAAADKAAADKAAADKAAADKAAADKAVADKAVADKAAANLKLQQEEFDLVQADYQKMIRRISDLKIKYPNNSILIGMEIKMLNLPISLGSDLTTAKYNIVSVNKWLDGNVKVWQKTQKMIITCIKGKVTKKVTGINPKCPSGYKLKT